MVITAEVKVDARAVAQLRAGLRGELLQPGDPAYDLARAIWNGMIDRRPALIVRCHGTADVIRAVNFARENDLLVSIKGGGHNIAGSAVCDGGLMIDLSPMKGVRVDPVERTARAEPGLLLGEVDHETQQFGLALPAGVVSHTGMGGLTLGGGFGWLSRKFGLTIDHLESVDIVTADGQLVKADESQNADLFWGIRGGGGNFGIVTSFKFRLVPLGPTVLAGMAFFPAEEALEVMRRYRDYVYDTPESLTTIVSLRIAPAMSFLPESIHGRKVVGIGACYAGDPSEGETLVAPLRRLGTCLFDLIAPKPFTAHQQTFDATVPHFNRYFWKSHYLPPLSDGAIDTMLEYTWAAPAPLSYTIMFQLGGAVSRISGTETAYGDRGAAHAININSAWTDPAADEENIGWARRYFAAMEPFSTGGVYMNFLMQEGEDRIRAAYGAEKYDKLVALKTKYDPSNFFRLNQNIRPAT